MPANLPDHVKAAVDAGEAEYQELYGRPTVRNAPDEIEAMLGTPQRVQQAPENIPADPPKPAAPPADVSQATQDAVAPTPAPEPTKPVEPDPWEHKYNVLQGKYNAEVPRYQAQAQQAARAVEELTNRLQEVEQQLAEKQDQDTLQLSPEETAVYGEDLIALTRRIAADEAARATRKLAAKTTEVEQRVTKVADVAAQADFDRFISGVTAAMPDWQRLNTDQGWLSWLGEYDPMLRKVRQVALDEATDLRDARSVAAMFAAYKATLPQTGQTQAPANLQQQVVPRTTAVTTDAQMATQKRLYTEADIKSLFAAHRRGEFTGQQWVAISAEIDSAVAEGRVR